MRRTGRGRALSMPERKTLWTVFEGLLQDMAGRGVVDWTRLCRRAEELVTSGEVEAGYDAVLVDEAPKKL